MAIPETRSAPSRKTPGQITRLGDNLAVALLERLELGDHHVRHLLFQIAVAHAGEARFHFVVARARKSLVDGEQVQHARPGGFEIHRGVRIGGGAHDRLANSVRRVQQRHRVVGAGGRLAHLLRRIVQPHHPRADRRKAGARNHEGVAVQRVEALRDVARQFQVLGLVFAHRNDARLIEQDIGGHQHGILQQPIAHRFLPGGLGFVLRHAFQPPHRRYAGQHPRQFGMGRHRRLHHDGADLGVDARRQVERGYLLDFGPQLRGLLEERDRMKIDDAEDALVIVLDAHPVLEGAQVVADMEISGRLHAGKDARFHGRGPRVTLS